MSIFERVDKFKQIIDSARPFEGKMLEEIRGYYRIGLTWSSNALEGNTLTESETKILLEDGLTAGGRPLRDSFEALGHAEAYDFMFSLLGKRSVSEEDVLTMHRMFYHAIDSSEAGRYRKRPVLITGSEYPVTEPGLIQAEMISLFEWVNRDRGNYHPVAFAAQLHKRFVFIHPFVDGNGRISRLLMNAALIQEGYLPAIIPPVLRADYIGLLERAHTDDGPFVEFIVGRVLESEKEMMRLLHIPPPQRHNRIEEEDDRSALAQYLEVAEKGDFVPYREARKDWEVE